MRGQLKQVHFLGGKEENYKMIVFFPTKKLYNYNTIITQIHEQ